MESKTEVMSQVPYGMSNLDFTIDDGFEKAIIEKPGKVFGKHYAYNFIGRVWFDNNKYYEEVWVHRKIVDLVEAESLEELMETVNRKYGDE